MGWLPLAHREFDELIRSRGVWIFGIVLLIGYYLSLNPSATARAAVGSNVAVGAFQHPVRTLVPIAALLFSYRSVISERESGSIKFVAGMPHGRSTILLGKVLGRSAALGTCLLGVFAAGAVIGAMRYGAFSLSKLLLFVLASELYVLVHVSIGTGLSAITTRSRRALGALIAYYLLIVVLWLDIVSLQIYTLVTGVPVDPAFPPASPGLFLWRRLSPLSSYDVLTNAILGIANSAGLYNFVAIQLDPYQSINVFVVQEVFDRSVPFYLSKWFSLVILGGWISGSLLLGAVRLRHADLASGTTTSHSKIRTWIDDHFIQVLPKRPRSKASRRSSSSRYPSGQSWSQRISAYVSPRYEHPGRFTRWVPLARKEFATTVRYRSLWVFVVLFLLWAYLTSTPPAYVVAALGPDVTIAVFQWPLWFLLPFVAVIVSYRSISAERESGSIKFVAGMPQSRGDILLGKIAGRTAAVGVATLGAMCLFIVTQIPTDGLVSPGIFVFFVLVSLLYIVLHVSLATGISAMASRSIQVASVVFGYLIVFNPYIWLVAGTSIYTTITGVQAGSTANPPTVAELFLFRRLSPFESYTVLTNAVLGVGNSDQAAYTVLRELRSNETPGYIVGEVFTRPIPYYLSEWFPLFIFLVWTLVPVGIGYVMFTRSDLG